ncbi:MAG: pantoate--beta-alanine ligase [Microbacterium sp.]|uniref:pantoate--beta-alanine ligase n=1 Tax=Microbacterium sp. TaxID=51671 RepID=UPI003A89FE87
MKVVRTVAALREVLADTGRVGFVPTMGALHEGHLSLVQAARAAGGTVVLSVFVNPTQFDEASDLDAYPRDERRDLTLAEQAGVDLVFVPGVGEMYPDGFATTVSVTGPLTETLEGAHRGRAHFDGVATVVAKLLLAVRPDAAYFGEKDAQQVVVVRRMVRDLGLPVEVVASPTARDTDGLALSSRNARLSAGERAQAAAIPRVLQSVVDAAARGETEASLLRDRARAGLTAAGLAVEYVEIADPDTLEPVAQCSGRELVLVAARAGAVRLIDNMPLGGSR